MVLRYVGILPDLYHWRDGGGTIIAAGTPEAVAKKKNTHTGACLAPLLTRTRTTTRKKKPKRTLAKATA